MNTKLHQCECLIAAAGLSSRMGQWKAMLPFGEPDQTILDCSIANALNCVSRVILVTGYRGEELFERYTNNKRIQIVHNPDYKKGLFSSLQSGIQQATSDHLFITHGDMPFIPEEVFINLFANKGDDIVFPVYQEKAGHPVLLNRRYYQHILNAPVESRMKSLLTALPHRFISVNTHSVHLDIDTPQQYQYLCNKAL
ncbi:molybdenum cofactor cytidylyltransferase [Endozoicomonas lisbonensis]|uniref:Molybdenum cofactor cytidylyltransferase n=1 Tax=Endozoicomonas lisbonensis TaxID=3120522 RepID=A0ABV2SE69_9GAMM